MVPSMASMRGVERVLLVSLALYAASTFIIPRGCIPPEGGWPAGYSEQLRESASRCSCSADSGCCWCCADGYEMRKTADRPSMNAGPLSFFSNRDVEAAPTPTLSFETDSPLGNVAAFTDRRGHIFKVHVGGGQSINVMTSRPGSLRSGDLHNCTQHDLLIHGKVRLLLKDLQTGIETTLSFRGDRDVISIPARTPHLFQFLEDSLAIEWWDCPFQAWFYRPFRDTLDSSLKSK